MKFIDAAYLVLKNGGKSIPASEITRLAFQKQLITSEGKTPERTMATEIYRDISQNAEESLFVKVDKGLFGLREWSNRVKTPDIKTSQKPISHQSIVDNLRNSQTRSDSPNEFEEAIRDAFISLGFEGELIGGSGDTDVILTANIGKKSFKVSVDGKTSKSGRIIDRQIDWMSLADHKQKNKADFTVVVGPGFAEGNLQTRARQQGVSLITTDSLIKLVESHTSFPFTLTELRDLFGGKGDISTQLEDLLSQNHLRRNLLEQFRVIIEEMQSLQDRLGYFTFDSLAGREKIEELDIEPNDIEYIIRLLKLPFINGVQELTEGKYLLVIRTKDIANLFLQISKLLTIPAEEEIISPVPTVSATQELSDQKSERISGSKYFKWYISGQSIIAEARKENPYKHHCPIEHFETIIGIIQEAFRTQNLVSADQIFGMLQGQEIAPNRMFKGKPEDYKIRMALGILEIEGMIKWTGSKRPIEYKLDVPIDKWKSWSSKFLLSG